MTTTQLTFPGAAVGLALMYLSLRTWWKGGRHPKDLLPFAGMFLLGSLSTMCAGGVLGWLAGCSAVGVNQGGAKAVGVTTGTQSGALAHGSLGALTPDGAVIVFLCSVAAGAAWKAAGKLDKRKMIAGGVCGATLTLTAGVAGALVWLPGVVNTLGASLRTALGGGRHPVTPPRRIWRRFVEAVAGAVLRLHGGSVVLAQRLLDWACSWCRSSYRHDLTGVRAALGPLARFGLLLCLGWLAARTVRTAPAVLWLISVVWGGAAAWIVTRNPAREDGGGDEPAPHAQPSKADVDDSLAVAPEAFAALVRELAGGGAGAHLAALAERLTGDSKDTDKVRALCRTLGVPWKESVRQPGRKVTVSTGVRVKDLPASILNPFPIPPNASDVAVVSAGQVRATGPATTTATPIVEEQAQGAVQIIRDGQHRTHSTARLRSS
ncbi:hypothetical protein [Streptomyces sp. NPDC001404]|uniref:hypothetical protein n=1 Tax=Streptomyces sp. NPDC001404 TaxID=3364571 RepID=UPI0036897CF8